MSAAHRSLILAALLACGAIVQAAAAAPAVAPARWPASAAVFDVAGWSTGDAGVDSRAGIVFVSRRFTRADGRAGAVLDLATSTDAKRVYRAGPEVPFAGAGYSISAPLNAIGPSNADRSVFVATRGRDTFLVFATYGERRGLVGNGPIGWALATFDGLLGWPNDYFEATLALPLDDLHDAALTHDGAALADRVFIQIADWYAR
jgi:hypothetical protein